MNVCCEKLPVKPEIFRIFRLEDVLGKALLFKVHLIKSSTHRLYKVMGFLTPLIGGFLFTEIELQSLAEAVEFCRSAAFFKILKRHRIEVHRIILFIKINKGFAQDAALYFIFYSEEIRTAVRHMTCKFLGKGRRDSPHTSQYCFAVGRQGIQLLAGDVTERNFILLRRILINHTRKNLADSVYIKGHSFNGVNNFAR